MLMELPAGLIFNMPGLVDISPQRASHPNRQRRYNKTTRRGRFAELDVWIYCCEEYRIAIAKGDILILRNVDVSHSYWQIIKLRNDHFSFRRY